MPTPDTAVDAFAQFGLAGLVILALFYLVLTFMNSQKQLHDSFITQIQKQSEAHADERKQWLEVSEKTSEILRVYLAKLEQFSSHFEGK